MEMKTNNKVIKFWAKFLSVVLMVSMAGGYTYNPVSVNADQLITEESETEEMITREVATQEPVTGELITEKPATQETVTEEQATEPTTEEPTTEEPTTVDPEAYYLIAHRGYSGYAPANSLPAFEKAVAAGFTTIELDVRRSKADAYGNATWVISHDDSLVNTMGVDKKISELTYSQILQYSYTKGNGIESYKNLKIVTLEQILQLIKKCKGEGLNINWQIEIKNTDDGNYTTYFENEIVKPIVDAEVQDCVTISSFTSSYLKKIKAIDSNLKTWFLSTILDEEAIEKAHNCAAEGISFKGTVNYTTQENIKAALAEGFRLGTYTINSPVVMGTYYQWGVRYFSTDELSPIDVSKNMLTGTYNVNAFVCTLSKDSYKYNGTRRLPKVTVTYKEQELVEGVNYTLSYSDNKNPGTATVYISGINNCKDEQKLQFTITLRKVTGFKIAASKTTYVKLSWTKVQDVTGYIIYQYNYTKKKYEAIKTISNSSKVTYKVKKLTSATKYKFRVKAYLKADGKTYKSTACTKKTTYTRPAKAKLSSLTRYSGFKRLRVKWKAVPRCTGYNIKIATDKKMKNVVGSYTVKGNKNLKLKIKKLSKKKTYYVKVRAYLKAGKTTYNGVYSTVMKSAKKSKKK